MLETPIALAESMPSLNGKNASDTIIDPLALSPALRAAILTASTLLVWPGPTPTVQHPASLLETSRIALDFTSESMAEPNLASAMSWGSIFLSVTHLASSQSIAGGPCTWASQPPSTCLSLTWSSRGLIDSSVSILLFFFSERISRASCS